MMNTFLWSVRRELWENRSVYIAPLAAGAIFLFGFMVRLIAMAPATGTTLEPYTFATLSIMVTGVVVAIFYCLEALYAERRDRSIMFWKSLPVSDRTTVLAKASIPLVVLPLFTTAVTVAVHFAMLLLSSMALAIGGHDVAALWREVSPVEMAARLLYHMIAIHGLWYAPVFAWLLLASAWARRAPFLWAGIPILAVVIMEKLVLASSRFLDMLTFRVVGGPETFIGSDDPLGHIDPAMFLGSPALWIGFGLTIVFLAAAVRVRRHRGPA